MIKRFNGIAMANKALLDELSFYNLDENIIKSALIKLKTRSGFWNDAECDAIHGLMHIGKMCGVPKKQLKDPEYWMKELGMGDL